MEGFLFIALLIIAFALLGAAAMAFGVDSRIGSTDPRSPDTSLSL